MSQAASEQAEDEGTGQWVHVAVAWFTWHRVRGTNLRLVWTMTSDSGWVCTRSHVFSATILVECLLFHLSSDYSIGLHIRRVSKLAISLASNTHSNSVCSLWLSTKDPTLHYLTVIFCHTYYDRALACVLSVTSLWRQSLFTLGLRCSLLTKRSSSWAPA